MPCLCDLKRNLPLPDFILTVTIVWCTINMLQLLDEKLSRVSRRLFYAIQYSPRDEASNIFVRCHYLAGLCEHKVSL
jgi:hypothetical protein